MCRHLLGFNLMTHGLQFVVSLNYTGGCTLDELGWYVSFIVPELKLNGRIV